MNVTCESKNGRKYSALKVQTQKTNKVVEIPLSKEVEAVIEKHKGDIPKAPSNQKMNVYLKELSELLGINEDVQRVEVRGNKKVTTVEKKYNLVTCHTARRTFATNAVLSGMPIYIAMSLTGHSTESSFKKYIKYNSLDVSTRAADEDFFN